VDTKKLYTNQVAQDEGKSKEQLIGEVTELRRQLTAMETRLARHEATEVALRKSEAQNQALLNALPDLILQINRDGVFTGYSVGGLNPYIPANQFLARHIYNILPRTLAEGIMAHVQQALQTGEVQIFEHALPTTRGIHNYEARMVVCGQDEVLIIVRDIAKRKRAEQQVIRSERLAALGLLSAALAHEINNPLQIIQSHLDLLLDFPLAPGEGERYLQIIRYQIERLNAITRRVLNFARPGEGARQQVSMTRLVRRMLVLASKELLQRGVQISTNFRPLLPVMAIPDQIEQVLLNLLINAIESVPVNGKIHIAIYPEDNQAIVSFTSNSPSISPEFLPRIFEPFFTTKADGNGLGLWISHNLIEQHHGSIMVENLADGQGVVATVKLPMIAAIRSNT
jgi:signal transduction histidine kinase